MCKCEGKFIKKEKKILLTLCIFSVEFDCDLSGKISARQAYFGQNNVPDTALLPASSGSVDNSTELLDSV